MTDEQSQGIHRFPEYFAGLIVIGSGCLVLWGMFAFFAGMSSEIDAFFEGQMAFRMDAGN